MQSEKSKPAQSMITLKNDSLCFSFPEIDEVIRRLIEQHINSTLPAIIAADRAGALQVLRSSWGFREATFEERRKAENQLIDATPEKIERALRRKCISAVDRDDDLRWPFIARDKQDSPTTLQIEFQRTLRIPDDRKTYPLPAGFGRLPLRHLDDYKDTVPALWIERGARV
jgi:hypothetical protein